MKARATGGDSPDYVSGSWGWPVWAYEYWTNAIWTNLYAGCTFDSPYVTAQRKQFCNSDRSRVIIRAFIK